LVVAGSRHLAVLCPCQRTNLRHLDPVSSGIDGRAAVTSLRPPKGRRAVPRAPLADTLASEGAAKDVLLPRIEPRRHQGLHNRAGHAHRPIRERERRRCRFTSPGHDRRGPAAYGPIVHHCRLRRRRPTAPACRRTRAQCLATRCIVADSLVAARAKTGPRPAHPRLSLRATSAQVDDAADDTHMPSTRQD